MNFKSLIVSAISISALFIDSEAFAIKLGPAQRVKDKNDTVITKNAGFDYYPELGCAMRTRWEISTTTGESRFQVRNARLNLKGRVAPIISYYFQTDFCDTGKFKVLDAWTRVEILKQLFVQVGQYRMPFGTDTFRGPANYIFTNRSFMGKYMANIRGVGLKVRYTLPMMPIWIEGAVFNPTAITDHNKWIKKYAYAGKASWSCEDFKVEAGYMSLLPENVRINLADASVGWSNGDITVEGEYMYKHYTNKAVRAVHGFNLWGEYGIQLRKSIFDRLSFHGRFDSMTANSDGKADENGVLTIQQPARSRLTIGSTLGYKYKSLNAAMRLDYEKYFYGDNPRPESEVGDHLSLELIISF